MVGGHRSNGWVAELDGHPTLFLSLEYLGVPPHDDILVVHELSHLAQSQLTTVPRARTGPTPLAVMVEGVATAISRRLRPGHSDSAYLWMDEDHQPWLDSCAAATPAIASLLLEHADTPDDHDAVAPLLRARGTPDVPARAGYWVGDQIARTLLREGHPLDALLSMPTSEARDHVLHWARSQPRRLACNPQWSLKVERSAGGTQV